MSEKIVHIDNIAVANEKPLVLIGGLNVIESEKATIEAAEVLWKVCQQLGIPLVFKASFDKANRSSIKSFRGLGLSQGLEILAKVKELFKIPVITDVHEPYQVEKVAQVCDVLQVPAFLARQTDLIVACAESDRPLNIKKPQFLSPQEVSNITDKCVEAGNNNLLICERGTMFGYNNLVVDMLGIQVMKKAKYPIIFDVTHSLQQPGGLGMAAGGRRQFVTELALAGVSQGIAGLFLEVHPDPDKALCDGPCALKLDLVESFLGQMQAMDTLVKSFSLLDTK